LENPAKMLLLSTGVFYVSLVLLLCFAKVFRLFQQLYTYAMHSLSC